MDNTLLNTYRLTPVSNVAVRNLEEWIVEELKNLYLDFGQKIDGEQMGHEANRFKQFLLNGKFRNWTCGDVHSALQTMLDANTTKYSKVSVRSILAVLETVWSIKAQENRIKSNSTVYDDNIDREKCKKDAAYWSPYIQWWITYNVDPDMVSVHQYNQAKENGMLQDFTDTWRGSKTNTQGNLFKRN